MSASVERTPQLLLVPMSDGAKIAVHRYPCSSAPAPAVLQTTPYRKESRQGGWEYPERGFDFFVADVRGIGGSHARYEGLLSQREILDGVELVEWLAKQPFCNGKVALVGGSYTGANQLLIAARQPKNLVCIAPMVGPVDTFRDWTHRGGITCFEQWGMTCLRSGQKATADSGLRHYLDLVLQGLDNAGHHARSPEYVLPQIKVPTLLMGGWYDYFLRGTTRSFLKISAPKRLVIGPWGHVGPWPDDQGWKWLDFWLHGRGHNPTQGCNVRLYRTGCDQWHERESWFDFKQARWWPWRPFAQPTSTTLLPALKVLPIPPITRPEFPPESGFTHWGEALGVESQPLEKVTDLDGPIGCELTVTTEACTDFELHARLSVVGADNKPRQLTEGRLLASHRACDVSKSYLNAEGQVIIPWHPHDRSESVIPGKPTRLNIEINPVCHRLARGERLRLGLSLVRADDQSVPTQALIASQTQLLLPVAGVGA